MAVLRKKQQIKNSVKGSEGIQSKPNVKVREWLNQVWEWEE